MTTHVEHVMGMAVSIDVPGRASPDAVGHVVQWLNWVDATFSTYRPDSPISRLARGDLELAEAPGIVRRVLHRCDLLRQATGGYFDPCATGSLDPSGLVKGWAVDVASTLLTHAGVTNHAINAGGDIKTSGEPEPGRRWRAGVAHPLIADALCAIADLGVGALATSGIAERGAHVVDPHTGRAAIDLASVTVIGPRLALADGIATAALAMGLGAPQWLSTLHGYRALVVDAGGYMWASDGFPFLTTDDTEAACASPPERSRVIGGQIVQMVDTPEPGFDTYLRVDRSCDAVTSRPAIRGGHPKGGEAGRQRSAARTAKPRWTSSRWWWLSCKACSRRPRTS